MGEQYHKLPDVGEGVAEAELVEWARQRSAIRSAKTTSSPRS